MQKTKREIIEETAAFYNLGNRALDGNKSCCYKTEDGKQCAVGRCLMEDADTTVFEGRSPDKISYLEDILKEEYRGHSDVFWGDMQDFHDDEDYWTIHGLSEEGMERKEDLLETWAEE